MSVLHLWLHKPGIHKLCGCEGGGGGKGRPMAVAEKLGHKILEWDEEAGCECQEPNYAIGYI